MHSLEPAHSRHVSFRAVAVTKVFGETVALWDVDLDGRSGELIALHGANGSGKSTLFRIIAGLMAPTRGCVAWTQTPAAGRSVIGLLGHATHLFDELTALENVSLAARLAARSETVAMGILDGLGVAPYSGRPVRSLSAGTRRRVGLARLIATDPDVLLVDEPFAGLDQTAADLVGRVLADARDQGRLVLIATHDDARSRSMASSIIRLEQGRVRREALPSWSIAR